MGNILSQVLRGFFPLPFFSRPHKPFVWQFGEKDDMEDLSAKFIAAHGPVDVPKLVQNVPDSVQTAVADTAELFLPSWAKRVFGTCRNMYKLWNSGYQWGRSVPVCAG
jgi:hypothetical protein